MNILIVTAYYYPEVGAAASRIGNMAQGLKAKGHNVDILTVMPNYPIGHIFDEYKHKFSSKETIDGIDVYRYWTYATISKNAIKRFLSMFAFSITMFAFLFRYKTIKKYNKIIVQSPPILISTTAVLIFKKILRKELILNVSDLWPLTGVQLKAIHEGGISYRAMLMMERFIYKNSDLILGQSNEIINHIHKIYPIKHTFLYRNLQPKEIVEIPHKRNSVMKIVYAGLFGIPQNLLQLIKSIDFKELNVELHLYGGGAQQKQIEEYIKDNDKNIFYHGFMAKDKINQELQQYDLSLIPLIENIYGAVPSKIFDCLPIGLPLLYCGGGEAASIIKENKIGLVAKAHDYLTLINNIINFKNMSENEYNNYVNNCIIAAKDKYSFTEQMNCLETAIRKDTNYYFF